MNRKSKRFSLFAHRNLIGLILMAQVLLITAAIIVQQPGWILTGEIVLLWFVGYLFVLKKGFSPQGKTVKQAMIRYWLFFLIRVIIIIGIYSLIFGITKIETLGSKNLWIGFAMATFLIMSGRFWILQKLTKSIHSQTISTKVQIKN